MLRIITISIISLFIVSASFAQKNSARQSSVRKMGSFEKVKAAKGINVTLIEGSKEEVQVDIDGTASNKGSILFKGNPPKVSKKVSMGGKISEAK